MQRHSPPPPSTHFQFDGGGADPPAPSPPAVCQRLPMPGHCQRRAAHHQAPAEEISWPRAQRLAPLPDLERGWLCALRSVQGMSSFSQGVRRNIRGLPKWNRAPWRSQARWGLEPGAPRRRSHLERLSAGSGGVAAAQDAAVSCLCGSWGALSRKPGTPRGLATADKGDREREGAAAGQGAGEWLHPAGEEGRGCRGGVGGWKRGEADTPGPPLAHKVWGEEGER